MKKTIAVIAARKGSVRIPNKMFSVINGEAMIMRKLRQLLAVEELSAVYVYSDAVEIAGDVYAMGGHFLHSLPEFSQGNDPNGMIKDAIEFMDCDNILWAHPTNPFIDAKDYTEALKVHAEMENQGHDSLVGVREMKGHFWNSLPSPINFAPFKPKHIVAGDLAPLYAQNGGIFIRPHQAMKEDGLFVSGKPHLFVMDALTSWDIDLPWELDFAQHYAKKNMV